MDTIDVSFRGVSKHYGEVRAVDRVDFDIAHGSFVSFLGPSGCGKTTSLRIIAGFEQPSAGDVLIAGRSVVDVPAYRRPVNMVFQNYALFPHLDVFDNVAFGLRQRTPPPTQGELTAKVNEALELIRLKGYGKRRVWELSGGQQQRVALARALVNRPKVLLLDEPLAALDRKLRRDMQIELQNLQKTLGITFLLVTHDQEEALSMSDRVCIMRDGRIVQAGTPRTLYDEPVNRYVADFVGKSNFFAGKVSGHNGNRVQLSLENGHVLAGRQPAGTHPLQVGSQAELTIRPELIAISSARKKSSPGTVELDAIVLNRIFLGEHTEYLVNAGVFGELLVLLPKKEDPSSGGFATGERVFVSWAEDQALVLANN